MAKRKFYDQKSTYATYGDMNEQNRADGSIMMGRNLGMAAMPKDSFVEPYPNPYQYPDNRVMTNSDNVMGIDAQIRGDQGGAKRYGARTRY